MPLESIKKYFTRKNPTIDSLFERLAIVLKEGHVKSKFAEVNNSIKYVATLDTYELVWMNATMISMLPKGTQWKGKKCYNILQDSPIPCEFCTNYKLAERPIGDVITWEHHNEALGKTFLVRDFRDVVEGVNLRFENAIDITHLK